MADACCVYKARQPGLNRLVALKILPAAVSGDAGFADRFTREAQLLARLQHPRIVAIHDVGVAGSHAAASVAVARGEELLGLQSIWIVGRTGPPRGSAGTRGRSYIRLLPRCSTSTGHSSAWAGSHPDSRRGARIIPSVRSGRRASVWPLTSTRRSLDTARSALTGRHQPAAREHSHLFGLSRVRVHLLSAWFQRGTGDG
jgi:serine/threonine protein kinase